MTAANALDTIIANLELLREATRVDAAFHLALDPESAAFGDIQVARGMLATGNPEQLRGQSMDVMPWLHSRLGAAARLGVARYRRAARRPDRDAAVWNHLGIGSVLDDRLFASKASRRVCSASPTHGRARTGMCSCIC